MTISFRKIYKDEYLLVVGAGYYATDDDIARVLKQHTPRGKKGDWKRLVNLDRSISEYLIGESDRFNTIWRCHKGLLESGFGVALKMDLPEEYSIKVIKAKQNITEEIWNGDWSSRETSVEGIFREPGTSFGGYYDNILTDNKYLDADYKTKGLLAIQDAVDATDPIMDSVVKNILDNWRAECAKLMTSLFDLDPPIGLVNIFD